LAGMHEAARHAHQTDAGNAEVFVVMYGDVVRFDDARKRWLVWERHRWLPDADATVYRMALQVARCRHRAAVDVNDGEERRALTKFAFASESRQKIDGMLALARAMLPVA